MSIDPNTIQNLSQDYTGQDGDFSAYNVQMGEDGVLEDPNLDSMKSSGAMSGAAQGAALAQSLPIQNPIIKGALTVGLGAAGAIKGSGDADYAYRDANRAQAEQKGVRNQNNIQAAINSQLSGVSTLPENKATQMINQKEPTQATQTTDQLRSLGLT